MKEIDNEKNIETLKTQDEGFTQDRKPWVTPAVKVLTVNKNTRSGGLIGGTGESVTYDS